MTASTGDGAIRRSLLDSTAGLFAARAAASGTAPATPAVASSAMSWGEPTVIHRSPPRIGVHGTRPAASSSTGTAPAAAPAPSTDIERLPAREFQRLVDAIVDVIEQRVVDELERRGRRNPEVF